jgi:hypothetical protein
VNGGAVAAQEGCGGDPGVAQQSHHCGCEAVLRLAHASDDKSPDQRGGGGGIQILWRTSRRLSGGLLLGSCALGPQLNACPLLRQGHTEIGRRDACGKERFPPSQFSVGHGID